MNTEKSESPPKELTRQGVVYRRLNLGENLPSSGVAFIFRLTAYYNPKEVSLKV